MECVNLNRSLFSFKSKESRTPHGVRGLKLVCCRFNLRRRTPHGVREFKQALRPNRGFLPVALHTERVNLNLTNRPSNLRPIGRTPHGARGLKCIHPQAYICAAQSHSMRSAWIKILTDISRILVCWSHSTRSAWIKIAIWTQCVMP